MSDTKSFKAQLTKKDLHKKGQISGGNEGPIGSSGKRRGLGFQDAQRGDSKILKKTIQKKHLVSENAKKKGKNEDERQKQASDDDEPSKYSMFKKKSEKKSETKSEKKNNK